MNALPHTMITTPNGEELVLISRSAFEAIEDELDAAAHERTMASVARGEQEMLSSAEVSAALAAPTPLAFWRHKRGLSQQALADRAAISKGAISKIERGLRQGDPVVFLRLARALRVRMEDLVVDRAEQIP